VTKEFLFIDDFQVTILYKQWFVHCNCLQICFWRMNHFRCIVMVKKDLISMIK